MIELPTGPFGQGVRGAINHNMLAGLLGVCLATILSVCFQFHVAVHTRPLLDPALHLNTVDVPWSWDRKGQQISLSAQRT